MPAPLVDSDAVALELSLTGRLCLLRRVRSKFLGTLVILGGVGFKVPQILKIAKNRSAAGVAISQYLIEMLISAITLARVYHLNAPFSTYGESVFILIQNIVLVFQISFFNKASPALFVVGWGGYLAILAFLFSDWGRDMMIDAPACTLSPSFSCSIAQTRLQDFLQVRRARLASHPTHHYPRLCLHGPSFPASTHTADSGRVHWQYISILFVVVSRVPQIVANFRTRNVENLSIITVGLNLAGASIR